MHRYTTTVTWTGDRGTGTSGYAGYGRGHDIAAAGRPVIPASSDPAFRGEPERWNPEQLLLASLASCHMLWYLHLCATGGVVVRSYVDTAVGTMREDPDGGGQFTDVLLRPVITVAEPGMAAAGLDLHDAAHRMCFIARSVNFPVRHDPQVLAG
jgi:organic hydroperoxide reductase OsmC/OhrA